jgi:hypothetical protein
LELLTGADPAEVLPLRVGFNTDTLGLPPFPGGFGALTPALLGLANLEL